MRRVAIETFWIDPRQTGPQLGIATTSLLTIIAYRFLLGNLVPRVSYLTRLDIFIFAATVLVFVALVEAIFTSQLVRHDKAAIADRVDCWMRVLSPVCLIVLLWYALG